MAEKASKVNIIIVGDASKAKKALGDLEKSAGGAESKLGKFGKGVGVAFAAVSTAAVTAGVVIAGFAFKAAKDMDKAYDTIRTGTGATGQDLEKLKDSFKTVFKTVPADAATVGTAIADLNTRTGQTGKGLEDLAKKTVLLSKVAKEDVGELVASTTRVFGDWSIATERQSDSMDYLFKISQNTGIGVGQLSETVVQFGAPLRQLGFDFETSAAMLGKWEKEGVNIETVLAGMKFGLGNFAKAGKDAKTALVEVSDKIRNAGSLAEANKIAIETFGKRAGPDMAAAIREGRFDLDELLATLAASPETIEGAAEATYDFGEKWAMVRNKIMVILEPLGVKLMDVLEKLFDWVDKHMPEIQAVFETVFAAIEIAWREVLAPVLEVLKDALVAIVGWVVEHWPEISAAIENAWRNYIEPAFTQLKTFVVDQLFPAFRDFMKFLIEEVWPKVAAVIKWAWENVISPALKLLWAYITDVLIPTFKFLYYDVVKPVWEAISSAIKWAWENVIRPGLEDLKGFLDTVIIPVFWFLYNDVVKPVFDKVGAVITTAWNTVIKPVLEKVYDFVANTLAPVWDVFASAASKAWGALKGIIGGALKAIAPLVSGFLSVIAKIASAIGMDNLANIARSAAGAISNWGMDSGGDVGPRSLNKGGFVPGSGPDKDSVPAMLTPGEFVLSRRATQRIPARVLERLNQGLLGDIGLNRGGFVQRYAKSPDEVLGEGRKRSGPYLWGGFGPRFDCSGFMAWLSNFAATGNGASGGRWATAQATGYPQRLGRFVKGKGDPATGFSIGVRPTGYGGPIGHTAGTVAGTNVESSGAGSRVGGTARGWDYGPYKYHLPDFGGPSKEMLGWFKEIKAAISALSATLATPLAEMMRSLGVSVVKGGAKHMLSKVPFGGTISKVVGLETYDQGGVLRPGYTMAHNATGSPELVLTAEQAKLLGGKGPREISINVNTNDGFQIGRAIAAALVGI